MFMKCKDMFKLVVGSFTNIQHHKPCLDSTNLPSLHLESWMTGKFLIELELVTRYSSYTQEALLKGSLSRMQLSLKSPLRVLDNRDVLDVARDGVWVLEMTLGNFTGSLKFYLDLTSGEQQCSWSQRRVTESLINIQHEKVCQDYTYPPSLFLESWRTWMLMIALEMESGYNKCPREGFQKIRSWSNIRKLLKAPPFLKVSP